MAYVYSEERAFIFSEDGQVLFLAIRDNAQRLLKASGAVRCQELISGNAGSVWSMLACVDRLCELGEIREVQEITAPAGQFRVFVRNS